MSITGLCNNSLNQISNDAFPPPTPADLQGFWEMVMLQVNHVDSLFKELEVFKANNWKVRFYFIDYILCCLRNLPSTQQL